MADKNQIINLLINIADKLEFLNENPYRIKAFRTGADAIRSSSKDINKLIKNKKLTDIKGIGKGLESVIYEYAEEGESKLLSELLVLVPAEIEKLIKLKSLNSKKVKLLYEEAGIENIEKLENAIREKKLRNIKSFNEEIEETLLKEIQSLKENIYNVLISVAYKYSAQIREIIKKFTSIKTYSLTGELRRGMEIISALEYVLLASDKKIFKLEMKNFFGVEKFKNEIVIRHRLQIPLKFYVTNSEEEYAETLFLTTGSDEFIRKIVVEGKKISGSSEEAIFINLNAPFVTPEMREGQYFEVKKNLRTNSNLAREAFKGLLHFHSTYSDGKDTLEKMLMQAEELSFSYAAICDHSKFAYYANGLSEERVLQQTKELNQLALKQSLQLFQGIECDILKDGALDYDEDFRKHFDFVVISIHKRFNLSEKEMTARMVKAIENPVADLLAHASGRFLLQRAPYEFNTKKIIDACAANNVAIEINSNPKRLDLDWRWIYYAREKDCLFSINPDAHSTHEINFINFGIKMGRKGGLQASEVINCFDAKDFIKFLNRKVKRNLKVTQ